MDFKDVINLWPTPDKLAAEIGQGRYAVRNWRARNYIRPEYWGLILATPIARKARLTDTKLRVAAELSSSQ